MRSEPYEQVANVIRSLKGSDDQRGGCSLSGSRRRYRENVGFHPPLLNLSPSGNRESFRPFLDQPLQYPDLFLLDRHQFHPFLFAEVVEFLVEADYFEFGFEVDLVVMGGV